MAITSERAAVRSFVKSVSSFDFNPRRFAVHYAQEHTALQVRAYNVFMGMCEHWARMLDNGAVDETDGAMFSLCCYAKRILDIVPPEMPQ